MVNPCLNGPRVVGFESFLPRHKSRTWCNSKTGCDEVILAQGRLVPGTVDGRATSLRFLRHPVGCRVSESFRGQILFAAKRRTAPRPFGGRLRKTCFDGIACDIV